MNAAMIHDLGPKIAARAMDIMNQIAREYDQQGMRMTCRCCGAMTMACHHGQPVNHHSRCQLNGDVNPWSRVFQATDMLRHYTSAGLPTTDHPPPVMLNPGAAHGCPQAN